MATKIEDGILKKYDDDDEEEEEDDSSALLDLACQQSWQQGKKRKTIDKTVFDKNYNKLNKS